MVFKYFRVGQGGIQGGIFFESLPGETLGFIGIYIILGYIGYNIYSKYKYENSIPIPQKTKTTQILVTIILGSLLSGMRKIKKH